LDLFRATKTKCDILSSSILDLNQSAHKQKELEPKLGLTSNYCCCKKNQCNVPSCFFVFSSYTPSSMGQKSLGQNAQMQCIEVHTKKNQKLTKICLKQKLGTSCLPCFKSK
jgi:hypothetical protein